MAVYKDKQRNTWYVDYKVKNHDGTFNHIKKRGFATKHEAQLAESQLRLDESTKHSNITFYELDEKYIEYKNAKPLTQRQERYRVQRYMSSIKDIPMHKLSKSILMNWYTDLIKEDCSTSVKNYCIYLVRAVSKFGYEFYDLPNNASVLKKLKKQQSEFTEMEVWSVEEFNEFISHIDNPVYNALFTFLYWTGTRKGEALALQYDDFINDTVSINKAIKHFKGGFCDLKNESSRRVIKLPDNLLSKMKPILEQCNTNKPFVFGGEKSLALSSVKREFLKGIKASKVNPIRVHDLRHSFVTNAINNDCNIVAVSKYIGHSTIEQTLKTYTHLLQKTDDEMLQKMNKMM